MQEKWFYIQPEPQEQARLFCFPHAGGGGKAFAVWQEFFGDKIKVIPLVFPGREKRLGEAAYDNIEALADALLPAIKPFLDRPYAFLGHSMGAKVAAYCASALGRTSLRPPLSVFVSGCRAPHIPEPRPIHHLDDLSFKRELRRFGATPKEVLENDELLDFFMPLLRADFLLDETFVNWSGEIMLKCPLHAFYGEDDQEALKQEVEPWKVYTS